ncbi:MAG: laccase domain-containing protein [Senegalimassilia faecalis]
MVCNTLPAPHLDARPCGARRISMLTDQALFDACGVRVAFTGRAGGVSEGAFASLNLGAHVQDNLDHVMENRARVMEALGAPDTPVIVPNQVHGTTIVNIESASAAQLVAAQQRAQAGADALAVSVPGVAALLCFADCTPVIIVSPTGRFVVAHAGWRGVVGNIAVLSAQRLAQADGACGPDQVRANLGGYNVYIGPHIHACHFEVGQTSPIGSVPSSVLAASRGSATLACSTRWARRLLPPASMRAHLRCGHLHSVQFPSVLFVSRIGRHVRPPWCRRVQKGLIPCHSLNITRTRSTSFPASAPRVGATRAT